MAQPIVRPARPKIFQSRYEVISDPVGEDAVWDYVVRDQESGERVLFKKVRGVYSALDHQRLLARLERRLALATRVFPRVIDAGREGDEVTWLTTPEVPTQTLGMLSLRDREAALDAFGVALVGLAEAHEAGLWHGRIMPRRIRVGGPEDVFVVDLGLYLDAPEGRSPYAPVVSALDLGWVAPEVIRGHRPGPGADVWQLGLTLHSLLGGGEEVFGGQTTFAKARCVLDDPHVRLPDDVPAPLRKVVDRCLEKSPRLRYRTARELLEAFREARAGGPEEPEEEPAEEEPSAEEEVAPEVDEAETVDLERGARPMELYVLGFGVVFAALAAVGWWMT